MQARVSCAVGKNQGAGYHWGGDRGGKSFACSLPFLSIVCETLLINADQIHADQQGK